MRQEGQAVEVHTVNKLRTAPAALLLHVERTEASRQLRIGSGDSATVNAVQVPLTFECKLKDRSVEYELAAVVCHLRADNPAGRYFVDCLRRSPAPPVRSASPPSNSSSAGLSFARTRHEDGKATALSELSAPVAEWSTTACILVYLLPADPLAATTPADAPPMHEGERVLQQRRPQRTTAKVERAEGGDDAEERVGAGAHGAGPAGGTGDDGTGQAGSGQDAALPEGVMECRHKCHCTGKYKDDSNYQKFLTTNVRTRQMHESSIAHHPTCNQSNCFAVLKGRAKLTNDAVQEEGRKPQPRSEGDLKRKLMAAESEALKKQMKTEVEEEVEGEVPSEQANPEDDSTDDADNSSVSASESSAPALPSAVETTASALISLNGHSQSVPAASASTAFPFAAVSGASAFAPHKCNPTVRRELSSLEAAAVDAPTRPFPFIDEVEAVVQMEGCATFIFPHLDQLPDCPLPECNYIGWSSLRRQLLRPSRVRLVAVNLPDRDDRTKVKLQSWQALRNSLAATGRRSTEVEMWRTAEAPGDGGEVEMCWELNSAVGIEEAVMWKKPVADDTLSAGTKPSNQRRHFFNCTLFRSDVRSLLGLSKLDWPGVTSPTYHRRVRHSITRCHFPQAFFPTFSRQGAGTSVCYFVKGQHVTLLKRFLAAYLPQRLGFKESELNEAEKDALAFLLHAGALWISPALLMNAGIPVYRVQQKPGEVVVTDGCVLQWGMVADSPPTLLHRCSDRAAMSKRSRRVCQRLVHQRETVWYLPPLRRQRPSTLSIRPALSLQLRQSCC